MGQGTYHLVHTLASSLDWLAGQVAVGEPYGRPGGLGDYAVVLRLGSIQGHRHSLST